MIKLILTDMDGTLLNSEHKMPEKTIETVEWLHRRGIRFGVASGREYANIRSYFPTLAEEMIFIADNGTLVYDKNKEIYVDCIETEEVVKMVESLRQMPNVWIVLCGKEMTYIECAEEKREEIERIAGNFYYNIEMVQDAVRLAEEKQILEISVFCEAGSEIVAPELEWVKEKFQMYVSGPNWIDILNKSAGKGNALKKLQEYYGWKEEECMAFGDYLNDMEMLKYSGQSYAMENAHPQILAMAKHIAPSNEKGGVIEVIRREFKIEG